MGMQRPGKPGKYRNAWGIKFQVPIEIPDTFR